MSNKQTTAMQLMIEYATVRRNNSRRLSLPADEYAMDAIIMKATELLTKEREIIEQAYDTAWENGYEKSNYDSGATYFTQTFKQD